MGVQAAERHARRARFPQRGQQRLAGAPAVRPGVHEQVAQHRDGGGPVPDPPGRAEPGYGALHRGPVLGHHDLPVRQQVPDIGRIGPGPLLDLPGRLGHGGDGGQVILGGRAHL